MEPLAPGETAIRVRPLRLIRWRRLVGARRRPAGLSRTREGPQDDEALVVQLAPGPHRVEVRKEGYRSYTAEVTVTAAHTSPLNISLPRQ